MEEIVDIYNSEKKLTQRTVARKKYFLQKGEYILIVLGLIERSDHKFLITQRAMDKKWAAGDWEISGGGVHSGETSFEGVCREVKEETGLDVSKAEGGLIYTYKNEDLRRGDNYFTDIYHFKLDFLPSDIKLQSEEAIGYKIADESEIKELADAGHFLHYKRIMEALDAEKNRLQ